MTSTFDRERPNIDVFKVQSSIADRLVEDYF